MTFLVWSTDTFVALNIVRDPNRQNLTITNFSKHTAMTFQLFFVESENTTLCETRAICIEWWDSSDGTHARHGLGGQAPKMSLSSPPWNILVKHHEVCPGLPPPVVCLSVFGGLRVGLFCGAGFVPAPPTLSCSSVDRLVGTLYRYTRDGPYFGPSLRYTDDRVYRTMCRYVPTLRVRTDIHMRFARTFKDLERPNSRVFQDSKILFSRTFQETFHSKH